MIGDFLKPPTDNLYKFMALSGLVMQLLFFVFWPWHLQRSMVAKAEADSGIEILKIDAADAARKKSDAEADMERMQGQQAITENRLQTLRSRMSSSERVADIAELKQAIAERDERDRALRDIRNATNEAIVNAQKRKAELTSKVRLANRQLYLGIVLAGLLALLSCGGLLLTMKGFSLWLDRVQVFQDAILKKQAAFEMAREDRAPHETS